MSVRAAHYFSLDVRTAPGKMGFTWPYTTAPTWVLHHWRMVRFTDIDYLSPAVWALNDALDFSRPDDDAPLFVLNPVDDRLRAVLRQRCAAVGTYAHGRVVVLSEDGRRVYW